MEEKNIELENIKEWFVSRDAFYSAVSHELQMQIANAAKLLNEAIKNKNKILIFGNGGSAAEAQHFAAELVCQFEKKRVALPAIALTTDSSIITAEANDFGFENIFSRQIEALGNNGDVVIGLTTSDALEGSSHSQNILRAFKAAQENGLTTIGFFSSKTKNLLAHTDFPIVVPHTNTAIIQEVHLCTIHLLCRLIEEKL